ncbi:MAG: MFS transporter [Scytonematopsis contorta HA4267-MV1]|nr:MFS transporter [Scytonematopsis contorta HA4267-MV1]
MLTSPLQIPNFRLLFCGQALMLCAVQFWMVTLTWLVLQESNSGLAVGTVLVAAAIPRTLFILIGGAISDRFPPNFVAGVSVLINTILAICVTLLVFLGKTNLSNLIVISGVSGLSDAFLYPAIMSMLPRIVNRSLIAKANSLIQGGEQIMNVVGPAAAGLTIGAFGLPFAFAINSVLFAFAGLFIYLVRQRKRIKNITTVNITVSQQKLASEIGEGLRYAWKNPAIRISLLVIAMLNFAMLGPIVIGGAELAKVRLGGSASVFGNLQAAYGVGALFGVFISSKIGSVKNPGISLIMLAYSLGVGLIALAFVNNQWLAYAVLALMGIGGGIVSVIAVAWLQQNTPSQMQGRVMSLLMFAAIALDPFSQAISGFLSAINLTFLFVSAGVTMLITGVVASRSSGIRTS